jgi:hypothetical protein
VDTRTRLAAMRDQVLKRHYGRIERLGIHAVPRHYMEPLPDLDTLTPDTFAGRNELRGIDLHVHDQLATLARFKERFYDEYSTFPRHEPDARGFRLNNGAYESVDAESLYCFIRTLKPSRVIEIGAGVSSLIVAAALERNAAEGHPAQLHMGIDPMPSRVVENVPDYELRRTPVQDVDLATFEQLAAGDVLFIDSSHVLATGSDVAFEYLTLLPRLAVGVAVHIHDIFLPAEYPSRWLLEERWFPNEQYVLQAFLAYNSAFEVRWAGQYLALDHADALADAFPSFDPASVRPGAFWIQRVA